MTRDELLEKTVTAMGRIGVDQVDLSGNCADVAGRDRWDDSEWRVAIAADGVVSPDLLDRYRDWANEAGNKLVLVVPRDSEAEARSLLAEGGLAGDGEGELGALVWAF